MSRRFAFFAVTAVFIASTASGTTAQSVTTEVVSATTNTSAPAPGGIGTSRLGASIGSYGGGGVEVQRTVTYTINRGSPTKTTPTDAVTNAAPTTAALTNAAPTNTVPTDATPTNAAPTTAASTNAAAADAASTNAAPTNAASATVAPTNEAAAK